MHPMIETRGLTKEYSRRRVISGLDLKVEKGELFGFLGPNGAGKTTTIRILTTLTKPTSGDAFINGFDLIREAAFAKAELGIVQQHMSLNRDLSVRENLEFHARLHHLSHAKRETRISELLEYVDLTEHADQLVDHLSGGMKRRTMIARALIHRPRLLILDEPTVGLDAQARRRVWDLIRRMNSDGSTVFLTTHYIEEAEALCDRVGIIHKGRLIALGTPKELRRGLGLVTVEAQDNGNGTKYSYFPDRKAAGDYIQSIRGLPNREIIVMRESNLEDVFVEITGQKVLDG
ncbi:MAG TPA: ABC transporter ATP-binding protein [Methanotrichaceae archaeon]|nr:ABC transporter ATP-binding protein [Methanotrichaceae archaeon]